MLSERPTRPCEHLNRTVLNVRKKAQEPSDRTETKPCWTPNGQSRCPCPFLIPRRLCIENSVLARSTSSSFYTNTAEHRHRRDVAKTSPTNDCPALVQCDKLGPSFSRCMHAWRFVCGAAETKIPLPVLLGQWPSLSRRPTGRKRRCRTSTACPAKYLGFRNPVPVSQPREFLLRTLSLPLSAVDGDIHSIRG